MPERQVLFYAIFGFRKVVLEIFSELDATKAEGPIFPSSTRSPEGSPSGPKGWPHHRWRGPTYDRVTTWCGPLGCPPISPFRLYIPPNAKTLKQSASIHEKFRSSAAIEDKFRGTEIYAPTPLRRGELPTKPSPSTPCHLHRR